MPDIVLTKYTPPKPPPGTIDIVVGCFFDGTQNNRINSRAGGQVDPHLRTTKEKEKGDKYKSATNSYSNDLSNVARLEKWYLSDASKYTAKFYVEGIGTTDLGDDEDAINNHKGVGYGAGGKVGIPEKVAKGCDYLIKEIKKFKRKGDINRIMIDTFGFSRGAAAARNFVSVITKEAFKKRLKDNDITYKIFEIRMVGLYDTVSSYDPNAGQTTTSPQFHNDVNELDLNAIKVAKRIFHLTAADEYLQNFALTPVKIAQGVEFSLPGAHADIGGSYTDNSAEVDLQILDFDNTLNDGMDEGDYKLVIDRFKDRLIDEGWYTDGELKRNFYLELIANRKNISNKYSFIPLYMMTERLMEVGGESIVLYDKLINNYSINIRSKLTGLSLLDVKRRLDDYIKGKANPLMYYTEKQMEEAWKKKTKNQMSQLLIDQQMLKDLKKQFLHFSAQYGYHGIGRNPNMSLNKTSKQVVFKRHIINNA